MAKSSEDSNNNYIKTTAHNYISCQAVIEGPRQVAIQGRSIIQDAVKIRGDLGIVRMGRYLWMELQMVVEPAPFAAGVGPPRKCIPMMIGNHRRIGSNCHI